MIQKTQKTTVKTGTTAETRLFGRENYMPMLIGLVLLAIGFFLMAGGKSDDPKVFNDNEVYSFTRITLAPILIVAGFVMQIVGIMRKQKTVV